jgi:hypothetical protein
MTRAPQGAHARLRSAEAPLRHDPSFNFPSRFLEEIPGDRLAQERHREPRMLDAPILHTSEAAAPRARRARRGGKYRVGMRVVHPMFGVGTVRMCDRSGQGRKARRALPTGGSEKVGSRRFARLEIV